MAPRQTVLAVATGPLLGPGATVFSGQCLRTWHFVSPMLAAGHDVHLYTVPIPGTLIEDGQVASTASYRGFDYQRCHVNDSGRLVPFLRSEIERLKPTALLGINAYPAYLIAKAGASAPFWADLNGWTMAEGQVRAAALGHDREYGHFWRLEVEVLLAADRFSAVSDRQAHAIFGELAMIGRLDHRTVAEDFSCTVPNAVHPDFANVRRSAEFPEILRGRLPESALFALWSGGFNSWMDPEGLVDGLAEAMGREPLLHFVATGGPVVGHDETTYHRFTSRAERRLPKGRWHMLGWCDYGTMLALHGCANCGLNLDGRNIESKFGARNRVTNMLGAGVPILSTRQTEVIRWVEDNRLGCVIDPGDTAGLAIALVKSVRESTAWRLRAARARPRSLDVFSAQRTTEPLLEWLEAPRFAADRGPGAAPAHRDHSSGAKLREWVQAQTALDPPFPATAPQSPVPATPRPSGEQATPGPHGSGVWNLLKTLRGKK
jgi:glycosyltransferase involved in cell wall biosynthesis